MHTATQTGHTGPEKTDTHGMRTATQTGHTGPEKTDTHGMHTATQNMVPLRFMAVVQ
jgi:hypothetical protein